MAGFKNALAVLPGLGGLAYLSIMDEFDPYKYNSFATNAGAQVHRLTAMWTGACRHWPATRRQLTGCRRSWCSSPRWMRR